MDISPTTRFSFITHTGEEFEGVGRDAYRQIKELLRKEPVGSITPVFFENSGSHRREPGKTGIIRFKCGKRPVRVYSRRELGEEM